MQAFGSSGSITYPSLLMRVSLFKITFCSGKFSFATPWALPDVDVFVSGAGMIDSQYSIASQRRGSTQSDTSALVSSLTRDLSQSPLTRDLSLSPSSSSLHMRSEGSPIRKESYHDEILGKGFNTLHFLRF